MSFDSSVKVKSSWLDPFFENRADAADPLDSYANVITPENIAFNYRVAGPYRRFIAFFVDWLILLTSLFVLAMVILLLFCALSALLATSGMPQFITTIFAVFQAWYLVTFFAIWWFYGAVCETMMNGQTFAKRFLRMRVVTTDGRPINGLQAGARNFLRLADMFPTFSIAAITAWLGPEVYDNLGVEFYLPSCLVAFVFMMITPRHQRLGDLISGTMVVYEESRWVADLAIAEDPRTPALAEYIPPNFVVSRKMARALADYVDQRRYFDVGRRAAIARHLGEPLLEQFGMLPDTSHDLLLCALYYRTFIKDKSGDAGRDAGRSKSANQNPLPPYPVPTNAPNPYPPSNYVPPESHQGFPR
jgi:uncharacterized RDD family membrane protein YckC